MQENKIQNKLRAAKDLGLEIVEEYKKVDGINFIVITFQKNEVIVDTFLQPIDKEVALTGLSEQRKVMQAAIDDIDKRIISINALE